MSIINVHHHYVQPPPKIDNLKLLEFELFLVSLSERLKDGNIVKVKTA